MLLEVPGQGIVGRGIACVRHRRKRHPPALREVGEEGVYGARVPEEAVQVGPEDQAVRGRGSLAGKRLGSAPPLRLAHVDLVAVHLPHLREDGAGAGRPPPDLHRRLPVAGEGGGDVEETEPRVLAGGPRLGPGIDDPAPEHLVAPADPDDRDPPLPGEPEVLPRPGTVEHGEVLHGVLRPGEDDAVIAGKRSSRRDVVHRRVALEEFEVGEVRYPGEADDGDPYRSFGRLPALVGKRERVLAREGDIRVRDHPEHRDSREVLEFFYPRREEPGVAPELVDDDPGDERPDILREEGERPVDLRKDPAPLDVGDKDDREAEAPGEPDVCDIAVVEVHLRRSPGPFHHHVPKAPLQPLKRRDGFRKEHIGLRVVVLYLHILIRPPEQHHL